MKVNRAKPLFLFLILMFFVANTMAVYSQLPSESDSLYVENVIGNPGDTVVVPIGMVNSISVGGFTLRFIYDDNFVRLLTVSLAERDSGIYEEPLWDTTQSGVAHIICLSTNPIRYPIPVGRGIILRARFYIDNNAVSGNSFIHFEDRGPDTYDNAFSDSSGTILIIPSLVDGYILVTPLMIPNGLTPPSSLYNIRNSPNPFNNNTLISFNNINSSHVQIIVYDIMGRKISTLNLGLLDSGSYSVNWNCRNDIGKEVSSGIYCYSLFIENKRVSTNRMVVLK